MEEVLLSVLECCYIARVPLGRFNGWVRAGASLLERREAAAGKGRARAVSVLEVAYFMGLREVMSLQIPLEQASAISQMLIVPWVERDFAEVRALPGQLTCEQVLCRVSTHSQLGLAWRLGCCDAELFFNGVSVAGSTPFTWLSAAGARSKCLIDLTVMAFDLVHGLALVLGQRGKDTAEKMLEATRREAVVRRAPSRAECETLWRASFARQLPSARGAR